MRGVWGDSIVEEASLTQNIYELRKALSGGPRYIENISRRGYRFTGAVTVVSGESSRTAVAVLPFRRLSGSAGNEYLGLGIADALITLLTNVPGLILRPLSAVSGYAELQTDALTAGRELNVALVVEGSVQLAGDRVRVTVRLLDIGSGDVVWAGKFDENSRDIFALQDALVSSVAAEIAPGRFPAPEPEVLRRRYTDSVEAYQLYQRGRYHWNKATEEGLWKALEFFRGAIAADPRYALAWVGIADTYTSLDWYGVLSTRDSNPQALEAAGKALEIDDTLAEAHASLAMARQYAWDWAGAEIGYRTALRLNPNSAAAHQWYGIFLTFMGRFDEALTHIGRAQELDPVSLSICSQVALVLLCARRYEEAYEQALEVLDLDASAVEAQLYAGMIRMLQARHDEAIAILRKLPPENPDFQAMLACAQGLAGRTDEAKAIVHELEAASTTRYVPPFWLAVAHIGSGDKEQALSCLAAAVRDPDDSLLAVKAFPLFDPIRSDPRFKQILRLIGLE